LATCHILFSRGASLSLADLNGPALSDAATTLTSSSISTSQKVTTAVVDIRKASQVNEWIEQTVKDHGKLDGAANLAGVITTGPLLADTTDGEFEFVMTVNVNGT
jgi:NAD(P)-dependent dehydrogenase (short-subunit alcohol dehydrogenase family)